MHSVRDLREDDRHCFTSWSPGRRDAMTADAVLAAAGWSLRRLAARLRDPNCPGEGECADIAAAGAALRDAAADGLLGLAEPLDTALIAWAVERIAARRIEAGDLGIDRALQQVDEAEGQGDAAAARQAREDLTRLADAIVADSFDELREFELCKQFLGDRAGYRARRDRGLAHLFRLAGLAPAHAH